MNPYHFHRYRSYHSLWVSLVARFYSVFLDFCAWAFRGFYKRFFRRQKQREKPKEDRSLHLCISKTTGGAGSFHLHRQLSYLCLGTSTSRIYSVFLDLYFVRPQETVFLVHFWPIQVSFRRQNRRKMHKGDSSPKSHPVAKLTAGVDSFHLHR